MSLLSSLHPSLSGEFDLHTLLRYAPPKVWRPKEVGDRIVGVVWKVRHDTNKGGYTYPVLSLMDSEQTLWTLSCAPVSLRRRVERLGILCNDIVDCTFDGTGETDEGRTYKKFTLERL